MSQKNSGQDYFLSVSINQYFQASDPKKTEWQEVLLLRASSHSLCHLDRMKVFMCFLRSVKGTGTDEA